MDKRHIIKKKINKRRIKKFPEIATAILEKKTQGITALRLEPPRVRKVKE